MLDTRQQGLLRYEERVRLERANGLRKPDPCEPSDCGCSPHEDGFMKGMTYDQLAKTPLRQNAVCPHTKVIVPVVPAFTVSEPVRQITAQYPAQPYRVVDMNPCDGRTGMLGVVGTETDIDIKHAHTETKHTTKVADTLFDTPNEVRTVVKSVVTDANVAQPIATNGTEPDNSETDDGMVATKPAKGKASKPEKAEKPTAETNEPTVASGG